jgi:hypothetical protein
VRRDFDPSLVALRRDAEMKGPPLMARGVDNARRMDTARVVRSQSAGVRACSSMLGISASFENECLFSAGDLIDVDNELLVCDLES